MVIWKLGITIQMIGFGFFMFLMEKRVFNGRDNYLIVIIYVILYSIGIFIPDVTINSLFILMAITLSLFIPFAYLYIAKISDGVVRLRAIMAFIGMMSYFIAVGLVSEPFVSLLTSGDLTTPIIHGISIIIKTGAVIVFFYGFKSRTE